MKASDYTITRYEYGPFGEVIRASGPMAKTNPFRFSTKFTDDESDLVYYGYRYYNPSTGRWLSRDPLTEPGFELMSNGRQGGSTTQKKAHIDKVLAGLQTGNPALATRAQKLLAQLENASNTNVDPSFWNSYVFVQNDPLFKIDVLGLDWYGWACIISCSCRPQVAAVMIYTPRPVPDAGAHRCCKATEKLFCSSFPLTHAAYAIELMAAELYYGGCMMGNMQ